MNIDMTEDDIQVKKQIKEYFIKVEKENKYEILKDIIYSECPNSVIIYANTRDKVDEVYKNLNSSMYEVHPYKREVIGTKEIIANISQKEIERYYKTFYR